MKPLFQLLIFLLPTQLGRHFWPDWSYVYGLRVDFLSPAVFLTDIVAALFVISCFPKVRPPKKETLIFLAIFSLNLAFSGHPALSLYFWARAGFFLTVGFCVYRNKDKLKEAIRTPLFLAVGYSSAIAIFQFIKGGSVGGPLFLLGERTFSVSTPGIATIEFFGKNYLRAYSVFPHPNVLAGFTLLSLIYLAAFKKRSVALSSVYLLGFSAILLSFSRTTFVASAFVALLYATRKKLSVKRAGTVLVTLFALLSLLLLLATPSAKIRTKSISSRLATVPALRSAISTSPFFGVGLGGFMPTAGLREPPHNTFLLVFSELGIVGFAAFFLLVARLASRISTTRSLLLLGAFLVTGFADHYWLTLGQGRYLFVILMGTMYN